jgi:7,8-dihydroneopterin aldolase/epimerase/oxygenase
MSEISQAFDHPEARSIATSDTYLDRISLRDHIVSVEIGAFQAERGVTQRISFNVVVEVRPSIGAETDDVDDILSYDRLAWAIATELEAERLNLLETLAERVALRILAEPQAVRVFLRIEKLDKGSGKLGVEIMRSLNDVSDADHEMQSVANVTVVHLTSAYLAQADLGALINQIQASTGPVLLTVGKF